MNVFAFVALLVAIVLFLVNAARTRPYTLVDVGLAFLTLGLLIQFCTKVHGIHF